MCANCTLASSACKTNIVKFCNVLGTYEVYISLLFQSQENRQDRTQRIGERVEVMEEGVEEEEKKITASSAVDEELDVYN